jgi:hypothetical protein
MRRATGFLLVYAGLGAAFWAVVSAGTENTVTPLQASAAPVIPATFASMTAGSPSANNANRLSPPPGTRWLSRLGEDLDQEFDCLALNIYWESRSEPALGQFAVAAVTLNRVAAPSFPDDVCGVVQQGGEDKLHRCQFSWWCDGKDDTPKDEAAWSAAQSVAYTVLFFDPPDPTRGALWYHADYVKPSWAKSLARVTKIGRHIYYRRPMRVQKVSGRSPS